MHHLGHSAIISTVNIITVSGTATKTMAHAIMMGNQSFIGMSTIIITVIIIIITMLVKMNECYLMEVDLSSM